MGIFLSILGFIFLMIILKFVYDTYLTNNTENKWQEHVKDHPKDAEYFEKKYSQQNPQPTLNYKGVYLYKDIHELPDGSDGVNIYGLFFSDEDAFYFSTTRDYSLQNIIDGIPTLFTPESFAHRESITNYRTFETSSFNIKMKFDNVKDYGDLNFTCKIVDSGLRVTATKEFNLNGDIESIPFLTRCNFTFHPIKAINLP